MNAIPDAAKARTLLDEALARDNPVIWIEIGRALADEVARLEVALSEALEATAEDRLISRAHGALTGAVLAWYDEHHLEPEPWPDLVMPIVEAVSDYQAAVRGQR